MQCSDFTQLLERDPDGPLSSDSAGHLDTCSNCHSLWHDLADIRTASLNLGAEEPALHPRVWVAIRMQLEAEGLIRDASPQSWFSAWFGWASRPALAGASLALVFAAASLLSIRGLAPVAVASLDEPSSAVASSTLAADLDRTLDGDMKRVMASIPQQDATLTSSLQQNLGIVDNLIAVCEKSVREQPDNQMARDYLYGAYQQKATLLATAMDHSTLEGR
jgi:hypothetical protein